LLLIEEVIMITKDALGRAIAEYREKAGMSQEDLAEVSGMSIHTIRSWEQGRAEPGTLGLLRLSHALNMDTNDLFTRAGELSPEPPK
jgi:transcriptional regulator with XRE-family HTH domain